MVKAKPDSTPGDKISIDENALVLGIRSMLKVDDNNDDNVGMKEQARTYNGILGAGTEDDDDEVFEFIMDQRAAR